MPYRGKQAQACYAQANACLKQGYVPAWPCEEYFKSSWPNQTPKTSITVKTARGATYVNRCGPTLTPMEPTTISEAKAMAHTPTTNGSKSQTIRSVNLKVDDNSIGKLQKVNGQFALVLQSFEDSRCPAGVICVWEGELRTTWKVQWYNINLPSPIIQLASTDNRNRRSQTISTAPDTGGCFNLQGQPSLGDRLRISLRSC